MLQKTLVLRTETYLPSKESCYCAGGSNVPALNELLAVFGMAFGDALLEGQFSLGEEKIYYASGVNIVRFPAGGTLHAAPVADKAHVGELHSQSLSLYNILISENSQYTSRLYI